MRKPELAALEGLAGHFSATWEKGEGLADAYLTIAGKRIAVDVASIEPRIAGRDGLNKPRLRFDRVALRFVEGLQAALHEFVPDGEAVILTVTAPIRLPAKTAAALADKIRSCLAHQPAQVELRETIHGNQIRVHLAKGGARGTAKVIGFVHNPEPVPGALLEIAQSAVECIGAAAGRRIPANFAGERWLVLVDEDGGLPVETVRHVVSQLSVPTDFSTILMVLKGGRVETLAG
jgi:hypothetical protein